MFSKFHIIIFDQINHYYPNRRFNNVSEVTSKTVITKSGKLADKNRSDVIYAYYLNLDE